MEEAEDPSRATEEAVVVRPFERLAVEEEEEESTEVAAAPEE